MIAVDLFCGAGGATLGLHRAGYTVALAVDYDADAVATHRAAHATPARPRWSRRSCAHPSFAAWLVAAAQTARPA